MAIAIGVGACGDDDDGASSDDTLASLAPADTFVFIEATVRPDEELGDAIEAVAARFPGGDDIGARIEEALDESGSGQTYAEDVEPWLGERAAMLIKEPSLLESGVTPPFLVETTDPEAALASMEEGSDDPVDEGTYEGVEYVTGSDSSAAVIDDVLVVAETVAELEAVIDVANGTVEALADADGFSYEVGDLDGAEAPGFLWLDQEPLLGLIAAGTGLPPEELTQLTEGFGYGLDRALRAAVAIAPDRADLHLSVPVDGDQLPGGSGELLGELPADASLAGLCATCLQPFFAAFEIGFQQAATADGVDPEQAREAFERTFGLSGETLPEVFGDIGYFVRAGGPLGIQGALVAEVSDADAVSEALVAARGVLAAAAGEGVRVADLRGAPAGAEGFVVSAPGLPEPISVVMVEDRLAVALGAATAEEALAPAETLADSGRLEEAEDVLGGEATPTLILAFDELLASVEPLLSLDPGAVEAIPYLEPIATVVAGSEIADDEQLSTASVTFD